jgi:acyl carrier protein
LPLFIGYDFISALRRASDEPVGDLAQMLRRGQTSLISPYKGPHMPSNAGSEGPDAFVEQFIIAVDFQNAVPVEGGTLLKDLPEWDSLAALGVIVMCDTEYGVTITGEDLKRCITVADIRDTVQAKRAK